MGHMRIPWCVHMAFVCICYIRSDEYCCLSDKIAIPYPMSGVWSNPSHHALHARGYIGSLFFES